MKETIKRIIIAVIAVIAVITVITVISLSYYLYNDKYIFFIAYAESLIKRLYESKLAIVTISSFPIFIAIRNFSLSIKNYKIQIENAKQQQTLLKLHEIESSIGLGERLNNQYYKKAKLEIKLHYVSKKCKNNKNRTNKLRLAELSEEIKLLREIYLGDFESISYYLNRSSELRTNILNLHKFQFEILSKKLRDDLLNSDNNEKYLEIKQILKHIDDMDKKNNNTTNNKGS